MSAGSPIVASRPSVLRILFRDRWMIASVVLLALLVLAAIVGPWLSPYAPNATSAGQFLPPGPRHWFGTDLHGRDLLTRLLCGARISFLVGLVGASVSLVIGVSYGAIAGYAGGKVDNFMMRIVDVLYALPSLIFVIVLISALQEPIGRLLADSAGRAGPR